jgi:putative transposase
VWGHHFIILILKVKPIGNEPESLNFSNDFQTLGRIELILPHCIGPPLCLGKRRKHMANKRPKPEEIVTKLRQVEVLTGQGMPRLDAIRQIGVTEQTYYRWKKKYGGMGTDQLKELKRLQKENERLRKAVSDLTLDKLILAEAAKGNF